MEVLFVILFIIPALLFVVVCCSILDNNKNKEEYNIHNSTLGVQCNSKEKCDWRFSAMCNTCQHNCGIKKDKNSYVAR